MDDKWKYEKVDIDLIADAEKNANAMSDDLFNQLCENINVSGLSSVPACYRKEDGTFVIISGHHRVKACRKLRYKTIGILYAEETDLSKDEILAIQLSHNSLHGEDDKNILRELFAEIESIDFKKFANIEFDDVGSIPISNINVSVAKENFTLSVVLARDSYSAFDELIGDVREASKTSDVVIVADGKDNEEALLRLKSALFKEMKIKTSNHAFSAILQMAHEKFKESKK